VIYISGKIIKVAAVDYTISFSGNSDLLIYEPSTYTNWTYWAIINQNSFIIRVQTNYSNKFLDETNKQNVKTKILDIIDKIESNVLQLQKKCETYNVSIKEKVTAEIEKRKVYILECNKQKEDLNPFN